MEKCLKTTKIDTETYSCDRRPDHDGSHTGFNPRRDHMEMWPTTETGVSA